jgi:hypothetical protein
MENAIYSMTQPKGSVFIMPVIVIIFLLALIIGMIGIMIAVKHTNILMRDGVIIINSFPYGKKMPVENISVDEIRTINLNENKEYDISIRTNGIGLPSFHSGWMKLNNGKKALVFITNKNKVLLMPVKDYVVLFSMDKTEEFIAELRGYGETAKNF